MFRNLWKRMRDQKGFTLIELIFVVIILAVLTGVALINLGGTEDDAKLAAVKADFHTLATVLKVYKVRTGAYPATLADLTTASGAYKPMLDQVPMDPNGVAYEYDSTTTPGSTVLNCDDPAYTITLK